MSFLSKKKMSSDMDYEPIEDDFSIEKDLGFEPNETFINWYSDFEDERIANDDIEEENARDANDPPMILNPN